MTVTNAWMIDELAYAGPEHLDTDFVAGFDRKQGYPDPEQELAAFEAHGLGPESVLVDLGAGTGQFALPAARRFGRAVQAVDVPVRFQVDERDHMARFARSDQDQPPVTGTQVFPLGVPASGNPGLHLFRGVVGQRHFVDGPVEDIGYVGGIPPLIAPDGYLHRPDTTGSRSCCARCRLRPEL